MKKIPRSTVERVCEEFCSLSQDEALCVAQDVADRQPELLSFVLVLTEELDEEVKELTVYTFFVLYRIFEQAHGGPLGRVKAAEIFRHYDQNEQLMESLEGVHHRLLERIATVAFSSQPHVIQYVVETILEAPYDEDPVEMSEEDQGHIFLLLKTVVDVLDSKTM
jgi:hypothetical protein